MAPSLIQFQTPSVFDDVCAETPTTPVYPELVDPKGTEGQWLPFFLEVAQGGTKNKQPFDKLRVDGEGKVIQISSPQLESTMLKCVTTPIVMGSGAMAPESLLKP